MPKPSNARSLQRVPSNTTTNPLDKHTSFTLALLTGEVTGTGYAAVDFVRDTDWTEPTLDAGDMRTASTVKTFTAGGAWTAATYQILATVSSGTAGLLIIYAALAATRTLANGDTLDVSHTVKLA